MPIAITIIESEFQIIPGIPKFVKVDVNIPANIFYTLDGTDPTTDSNIYFDSILLPTEFKEVTLKLFATNGTDTSSILSETWIPDKAETGLIYKYTNATPGEPINYQPFGQGNIQESPVIKGLALETVTPPDASISNGFDSDGNDSFFSGKTLDNYPIIYPPGDGDAVENTIGNLSAPFSTVPRQPIYDFTPTNVEKIFNPRSLVMYQDSSDTKNVDPEIPSFNKSNFFTSNLERNRDGAGLITTAFQGTNPGGSFVKSFFNQKEQKLVFYYYDGHTGTWIISKENFNQNQFGATKPYQVVYTPMRGSQYVYEWIPFVCHRSPGY